MVNIIEILATDDVGGKSRGDINSNFTELKDFVEIGGFQALIGDGVNAITTGEKIIASAPYDMTITGWTLLANETGSIVIDIWKDTYGNHKPTIADSITASAKPTISASNKANSSTLTGWTTSITKGDVIVINVDSASSIKQVNLWIEAVKV
jgi:hypothetical protein